MYTLPISFIICYKKKKTVPVVMMWKYFLFVSVAWGFCSCQGMLPKLENIMSHQLIKSAVTQLCEFWHSPKNVFHILSLKYFNNAWFKRGIVVVGDINLTMFQLIVFFSGGVNLAGFFSLLSFTWLLIYVQKLTSLILLREW